MRIKSVEIEAVDPKQMRYRTAGDWLLDGDGNLLINVVDTKKWQYNMLLAIHELVEVILCANQNITQQIVDDFDFEHQDDPDPGTHPDSPYHDEHLMAFGIEKILAAAMGARWRMYEDCVETEFRKTPKRERSSDG